jgi:hypothetical protein
MNKYKHTKIYMIKNDSDDLVYIGSTCSPLSHRLYRYCSDACNGKTAKFYKHIRTIGQFEFNINLLEEYPCSTDFEMRCREQYWMDKQTDSSLLLNSRHAVSIKAFNKYTASLLIAEEEEE